jgi:two-component system CheB/CheR fusion protein
MDEVLSKVPKATRHLKSSNQSEKISDTATNSSTGGPATHFIVGVGASAGGLEALEIFFQQMRPDAGLSFVVVQHLSPDFRSLMDELLSRRTQIAIHRVEDGMVVEPNAIYLIPPKKEMIITGGRLLLSDKDPSTGLSLPIDTFFRSLAQDVGERAVGIILSGTGSDGSRGIRAIHEAGGLLIAQSVETAKFDGMPRSAIDTGVVDLVLPPEEMSAALLNYIRDPNVEAKSDDSSAVLPTDNGMSAIYQMLRADFGIDFSHYKPNTVLRRIDRRLQLNHALDLEDYVEQLKNDPQELNLLYKDLLIGVTRFFRDPELFVCLGHEVIPGLLHNVRPEDEIRVWIAGCATGEEAYSFAILFHEALRAANRPINIKIFATDVHRASLEHASAGLYDRSALVEVTPERLERYFVKASGGFQVSQELRKMIVFAPHNVIKDAPFTKLDLISCRNLLIYLQTHAQKKALSLFHFGLKTAGTLILGPSENPGEIAEEFETLHNHWKIYRKRRDIRLPTDIRLPMSPPLTQLITTTLPGRSPKAVVADNNLLKVYDELLAAFAPPSFLVNSQRELLHSFAGAGRMLRVPDGRPSSDLLDMIHQDLRLAVAGALQRAAKVATPVSYGAVPHRVGDEVERLKISVRPISPRTSGERYFLISLEPERPAPKSAPPDAHLDLRDAFPERLGELEDELRYTKENLQATTEQMETTNEELQATNEELVASNEELQSTNEELHSVNEELYTVNAEYQRKITELTQLTDDIDNLLHSTDVGTIFLDRDLAIRKFTPKIAHAFQLLPQDVGRRIDSFAQNILHPTLMDDIRRVLSTAEPFECDVEDKFGDWFLLRILPYRSKNGIEGVIVTLIGISRLKETEGVLRRLSKVFMDGADPIIIEDLKGIIVDLNAAAEQAYGWTRAELLGQPVSNLIPPEFQEDSQKLRDRCLRDDSVRNVETMRRDRAGHVAPVLLTLSLLHEESGEAVAIASIAKDITVQKISEQEARDAATRRDQFLAMLSHELRNPLAAMLSATQVFGCVDDPAAQRHAAGVIERQSKHMARLLDDLLDVARVTQGKIHLRKEVIDLRAIIEEAVAVCKHVVDGGEHQLTVELPKEAVYVEGDSARLLQVVENLLTNAAKYTATGGQIRITLTVRENTAAVQVRDNGMGIAPEVQKRIFDLFVQGPQKIERTDSGMGIGLTMARSILQLHGGEISVQSDGGCKGSEFEFRLPITPKAPAPNTAPDGPRDTSLQILIVEDNTDSRNMLAAVLKTEGHDVLTAGDGVHGFQEIQTHRPAVALVDIGLPGMDGYELAKKVRSELPDLPIRLVALTGYGREEDRLAVLEAGFDEHLIKPVAPEAISRAIHQRR